MNTAEQPPNPYDSTERLHRARRSLAEVTAFRTPHYRGRLAPSPTGYLHLGHARTFWTAQQRAQASGGTLVLRNEDLDPARSKPAFVDSMLEDLRWFGFQWQEGPDCGGPFGPYSQSQRRDLYTAALEKLRAGNFIYPCKCSRKDLQSAAAAPHAADDELIYPGTCRPGGKESLKFKVQSLKSSDAGSDSALLLVAPKPGEGGTPHSAFNWRFLVPGGETISFIDVHFGPQQFVAGKDFGDFVVWRHDGVPAYQLAVVVDDAAMRITEVVRGQDLLLSTARQLLLYRALELTAPAFHHCPLLADANGVRLAKRHDALSLRTLRAQGISPETLRQEWCLP
jgi:glutamyl-tRNA synthetase